MSAVTVCTKSFRRNSCANVMVITRFSTTVPCMFSDSQNLEKTIVEPIEQILFQEEYRNSGKNTMASLLKLLKEL